MGGIAVLTFTNNAADIIHKRVCQFAGVQKAGYPHFIGTIDSWLHGYIAHPFGYAVTGYKPKNGDHSLRIIDATAKSAFLNNYSTKYVLNETGKPFANQYYIDKETNLYEFASGEPSLDRNRKNTNLQNWQINDLEETKKRFFCAGFATYQDIENICFDLFSGVDSLAKKLAERFPLIIVDECQDLSWIQLQILKALMSAGSNLHFVGDLNQAIYKFKKAVPEKVEAFVKENCSDEMTMTLSENFRSCQKIVDTCKAIVDDKDNVKGMVKPKLETPCLFVTYKKDDIHSLPQWFEDFVKEKRIDVSGSAIVARGWSTVSKLRPSGNNEIKNDQMRLAAAINLWKTGGIQAMSDTLKYVGQFMANKYFPKSSVNEREYYCPECVTSVIRWRLFLAQILDSSIKNNDIADLNQTWSAWAKKVRTHFSAIAEESRPMLTGYLIEDLGVFQPFSFIAFRGKSNEAVSESLSNPQQKTNIRITTIHGVKGETLEAIMLVSSIRRLGDGGHWTHWLEDQREEAARFAYVASSRPKHLLIWAIPEQDKPDYSKLHQMGFCNIPAANAGLPTGMKNANQEIGVPGGDA